MRSSSPLRLALLVVATVFSSLIAHAQYRASIQGVVTDPQGAVVQGAKVTLTDNQTNRVVTATTDTNGIYTFGALPPSTYTVKVEKDGFKAKTLDHYSPIGEQANALNIELELGEATQTVNVSADLLPAIDTETATVSGTITSNQIDHMPSFGRDVFQLIQLAPGVFGDGAQGGAGAGQNLPGTQGPGATGGNQGIFQTENGPQAIAHGQQYENNGISIDGISTTSAVWGGTTIVTPTEDSVDSVKIVSNSYDAEDGRFSGGQIKVISKSGTNQFHGSLFFTAHRPGLNAYQPFNGLHNKVLRDNFFFNQLGGSVGGPIWKNKIFAFFAYETVRSPQSAATTANGWYDTPAFDKLAPAGSIASRYLTLPGAGVNSTSINPSTCADAGLHEGVDCVTISGQGLDIGSPLTTPLGTHDPTWQSTTHPGIGNGFDGIADIANYATTSRTNFSKAQYNGRLDANVTAADRLAFAIYWVPQTTTSLNGPARDYNLFHHSQINEAYSVIWNRTISSSFLNELRANAAGWHWNEVASNPQSPVGLPTDTIDQVGTLVLATNIQQFGPSVGQILNQWTYTIKDVATKVIGRHSIKFGGEGTKLYYLNECAPCGVPTYAFFNLWDFLNDAPHVEKSNFDPHTGKPSTNRQDDRENVLGFFVQDDFKVKPNLTLNLGLRWSYFGPLYSKENNMYVAHPGPAAAYMTGLAISKGHAWNTQKHNFGPQIGFAWSPGKYNQKMVVRGGYGLAYNQEEIAISANVANNPGLIVNTTFNQPTPSSANPGILYAASANAHDLNGYPPNPNARVDFGPNGLPLTGTGFNVSIFPNTLPTMLTHHWSLDTQYDLGHQIVAILGYQGSASRNIFFHENPNAVPATLGYQLNPQISGGDYWGVQGYGNYNAALAELKHNFSHQFMADAQFMWAKSVDTSSGPYSLQPYPYNLGLNYGRSDYDVGKSFKLYGTWQPVFFRGNRRWIEKIAGGWSFSGVLNVHSGFPWSPIFPVVGGSLYCATCSYTTLFPAAYLGGAGTSTSNDQFKTGSNYPLPATTYFAKPTYMAFQNSDFGTALPQSPGVRRNSLNGPDYRALNLTVSKGFGLPNAPVLGENARVEFRLDAYNVFNNLNFKPDSIANDVTSSNFGRAQAALAARVITLGARFNF